MKKIKVAILWHQHQPYYKYEDEFLLPWVRLHGVKDYFDLPVLLNKYPDLKQTFNLAPSLMLQIEDYLSGNTKDKIQRLTEIPANQLTQAEKIEIIDDFFVINHDNLLKKYEHYKYLFHICKDKESAINILSEQDWRDIQVWYNLAWIGQTSKEIPFVKRLLHKSKNFSEIEKKILLEVHNEILAKITPEMLRLKKLKQIEISCSPMFHPILPLLIDSNVAREAMPRAVLPEPNYNYPEDARDQISSAISYYEKLFDEKPTGMWPSEGSISEATLDILASQKIKWVATDEGILASSLSNSYLQTYKYFPHKFKTQNGTINIFFRDHNLSDKIGFVYSNWNHYDAACDFREHILSIRDEIIRNHGEDSLDSAVIPIILDGENCWEFYPENGKMFLDDFFSMLQNTPEIKTVLFSECIEDSKPDFLPEIKNIRAGSWINANFSIWIGHQDDIKAWNMLSKLRKIVEEEKDNLSSEQLEKIMQDIYISEGSDWFWWYGPEHNAPNKSDFDIIFRWRLKQIYNMLNILPPKELDIPITNLLDDGALTLPLNNISPKITGNIDTHLDWEGAGKYNCYSSMSTMHQIGEVASAVYFGADKDWIYFRIETIEKLDNKSSIELDILIRAINMSNNDKNEGKIVITYENNGFSTSSSLPTTIKTSALDCIDIAINNKILDNSNSNLEIFVEFILTTMNNDKKTIYPEDGGRVSFLR